LFVPLTALLARDFGPMLRAERRTYGEPLKRSSEGEAAERSAGPHLWLCAVAPILITICVTVWLLFATGAGEVRAELSGRLGWRELVNVFGEGDSRLALVYGSLAGLLSAMLAARGWGILTLGETRSAAFDGARLVLPALAILWLAWSLSGLTGEEHLNTGEFLGGLLMRTVGAEWMPTIVFLLSSFVAFATGTSWGTMGILMPLVVPVTYQILAQRGAVDPHDPVLIASVGGVLAGAIFGDHCSPISDTTVLSSQASGCDHVAHVWTQLPYAVLVAFVSVSCGTLPVGFGASPWPMLLVGAGALVVLLLALGRRVDL
jgi:Na+/H+ antiporter NhaC